MSLEELYRRVLSVLLDNDLQQGEKICLAVSGGADSMGLLYIMYNLLHSNRFISDLHVVTIDHNLRKGSANEAIYVRDVCKNIGIPHKILKWVIQDDKNINHIDKGNVQQLARETRYNLLSDWCKKSNIRYLMIAHHMNDQAENILIRMERGSGVKGMCGMRECVSNDKDIRIIRPLLYIMRNEIEEYLTNMEVKWICDPSNEDKKYCRTRFRNFLSSCDEDGKLIRRLCRMSQHMQRAEDALNYYKNLEYEKVVRIDAFGYAEINLLIARKIPKEIITRILIDVLCGLRGKYSKARYVGIDNFYHKIISNKDFISTLCSCEISIKKDVCYIYPELNYIERVEINEDCTILWDHRFVSKIEGISDEYKIVPLGVEGWKFLLKYNNKLKEKKLYHRIGYTLPCLMHNGRVVSCPFLGYHICDDVSWEVHVSMGLCR